jgi:hypothetical protein
LGADSAQKLVMECNKVAIFQGVVQEVVELQEMGWGHGLD